MLSLNTYSAEIFGIFLGIVLFLFFRPFRTFFSPTEIQDQSKIKNRSSNIDFIRGISMIGIVIIHLDSYFRYYHPEDFWTKITLFLSNSSRFSVPAFIISSAFFLSYKSFKDYWFAKWKNLIVPYLIIGSIAYLVKYPIEKENALFDFAFKFTIGTIMAPYYFVPLLIQCYLLYALIIRKIQLNKLNSAILLSVSFGLNIIANTDILTSQNQYWNLFLPAIFANFIFFFIVGYISKNLFNYSEKFFETIYKRKDFLFSLVFCLFAYLCFVGYLTFKGFSEISNHFIFYPLGMFIALFAMGIYLEKSKIFLFQKLLLSISFIGKKSLSIFLIHPILIHFSFGTDPYLYGGPVLGYLFFLFINILIPIVIWSLYEKIKKLTVA